MTNEVNCPECSGDQTISNNDIDICQVCNGLGTIKTYTDNDSRSFPVIFTPTLEVVNYREKERRETSNYYCNCGESAAIYIYENYLDKIRRVFVECDSCSQG